MLSYKPMIKATLQKTVISALKKLGVNAQEIEILSPTHDKQGDFSTNVAFKYAKEQKKHPFELANEITKLILKDSMDFIEEVRIEQPGFINFFLSPNFLLEELQEVVSKKDSYGQSNRYKNKKVMVEFTDPNPFKEFHIGHLYSNIVGESISRLYESQSAKLLRANYQGDIGLHVAKSIWGLQKKMKEDNMTLEMLGKKSIHERVEYMGQAYALGTTTYEKNDKAKEEIIELNKKIYALDSSVKKIYELGRKWSLEYFELIYKRLGARFDKYYFESEIEKVGVELVKKYVKKGVFEESEGAIIFDGKKYGLHTRVFVNSMGLPTYEAKDLALAIHKYKDFPYDISVIITGNDIKEYFKVVLKALEQIKPVIASKTTHISHGMVRLPEGKMSSRSGKILTGEWLLDEAVKSAEEKIQSAVKSSTDKTPAKKEVVAEVVGKGAVKYALLKNDVGKNIAFNFEESINFEGNSGPYLQYAFVRCQSILSKVDQIPKTFKNVELADEESRLLRKLVRFPETVSEAAVKLSPSLICTYLFDLAQRFNLFYQRHPVLRTEQNKDFRIFLVQATAQVIKNGLYLLGVETVEKM